MGPYVLASQRDGAKISSELQPLREKQGYQVQEPGDRVESPQLEPSSAFSARNVEQFQVPYPEQKGVLCSLWDTSVTPLQCMQDPLAKQGKPSFSVHLSFDKL
jgi:hypothetical protein